MKTLFYESASCGLGGEIYYKEGKLQFTVVDVIDFDDDAAEYYTCEVSADEFLKSAKKFVGAAGAYRVSQELKIEYRNNEITFFTVIPDNKPWGRSFPASLNMADFIKQVEECEKEWGERK